jgi:hypothetical protein
MIGRQAVLGLALLSALAAFGFTAQSAFAATAKNTTPVTCVEGGGEIDFSDAHCGETTGEGSGKFGHVALTKGLGTIAAMTNANTRNNTTESTPAIFKGTIFGVKTEITCKIANGEGTVTPEEPSAKVHFFVVVGITRFSSCTVSKPAGFGCKVKEPIEANLIGEAVEGLGAGKNEMGVEFRPAEGETFAELVIEGCIFAGAFKLTGTAIATGSSSPTAKYSDATSTFTNAMTKETLKLAGNPAELSSAKTFKMKGGVERPIAYTTLT